LIRIDASFRTVSSAKIGVLDRTARAIASLGRLDTEKRVPFCRISIMA
jgi:hypothetical protein